MKNLVYLLSFTLSLQSFAEDMSRTESFKTAYKEEADGSSRYIGSCSTHEDYQGKYFSVNKTIVEYFEPTGGDEDDQKIKVLEPELIRATKKAIQNDSLSTVDDLTVEKITSSKFRDLDLYRLNVGVGGGNGMFIVFNRSTKSGRVVYQLMSSTMDGDIEYCDSMVWLKAAY